MKLKIKEIRGGKNCNFSLSIIKGKNFAAYKDMWQ